jgi:replicative DNA helicase
MVAQLNDIELEKAVLGAIIMEHEIYPRIAHIFDLRLFTDPNHTNIAKTIITLKNEGKEADLITLAARMKKSDYFNHLFDIHDLSRITDRVAGTALIEQHLFILKEMFLKREIIRVANESIRFAGSFNSDVFEVIDKAEKGISELTNSIVNNSIETSPELFKQSLQRNAHIISLKGKLAGITSGFREIDQLTGGWQSSRLIILAGATSMGKTALALDFLLAAALDNNPVGIFSLEMSNTELYARLQSKVSGQELAKINNYGIEHYTLESFVASCERLQNSSIYFDDTSNISIFQLKNKARRMHRNYGIRMIIVDYLQLMDGDKKGNREQEVATISRGLKSLAKELNIPIIALSQLSREIERRVDKEPKLSDLRESGSIEQDADMVCFIYRPEYYVTTVSDTGESLVGKAKFFIKKNRHGSLGEVKLDFNGRLTKFTTEGIPTTSNYEF